VNFGPGEEVPHLDSVAPHRGATCIMGTSGSAAIGRSSSLKLKEQVGQTGITDFGPEFPKGKITVPGGPIYLPATRNRELGTEHFFGVSRREPSTSS